jgi:hypothetical protein
MCTITTGDDLVTPSARVWVFWATASIVTLIAGVAVLVIANEELGWLLILLSLIGGIMGAGFIYLGRQSMSRATSLSMHRAQGRDDITSTETILPKKAAAGVIPARWTVAASVPSPLGYVLVGLPLAVVEVRESGLRFWVRPRIAGILFGIENLTITPEDNVVFLPVQRRRDSIGIELRMPQRPSYYFWTKRRDELMAAAAALGLEVSKAETA